MRTTLDLPYETFRQLKAQAALQGLKLKELVTQLIERGLATGTAPQPLLSRQAGAQYPIPIAREADGTTTPSLTNAQLHAILDEDDMAQHQRAISTKPRDE